MSAVTLETPYLDTVPDDLSLTLGLPSQEALFTADVRLDGLTVQLRLLGASHQVFAGPIRETVACLGDGRPGCLPRVVSEEIDGWSYRFRARTSRHSRAAFSTRVRRLRVGLDGRHGTLFGIFPGSPEAVTALSVHQAEHPRFRRDRYRRRVGWRTWHTYPNSREIVETQSWAVAR
ncbi:DUF2617 family protein [Streptomyces otsuchiensis]|uniref:DUF2617 family protein n=1 Tax=Streptomyces otsuchiensis TaxID=2681388 RepID=UPI0010310C75|nr:DUF2617 family protein [Streptomyces otsuchiensis]